MALKHELFIIDAKLMKPLEFAKRREITYSLINELLKTLNMKELGPLELYDAVDDKYPGWSFIQPITTSHISGHYFYEKNSTSHIHMDFYSCKNFSWNSIIDVLHSCLNLGDWNGNFIQRQDQIAQRTSWLISGKGNSIKLEKQLA